jgi:hypothetical protein
VVSALRIMPTAHKKMQQIILKLYLLGFLIGRFASWPIIFHIPLPLVLTFQIIGSDLPDDSAADDGSDADVGAGPAQSISFDHVSAIHPDRFKRICSFADVTGFRRAPAEPGLTMIAKVHFAFLEELPRYLT